MKTAALAVAIATISLGANAAGLGKLTVLSGIGQPLRAEIDLSATKAELSSMTARLAPPETFKESGVDYGSALSGIKVDIAKRRNGRPYLKLSSDRVVGEPFLDMLIQVDWAQGRLVREYTFLLDPPETLTRRQAVAPVTPPQAANAAPAAKPAPAQAAPAPAARETAKPRAEKAPAEAAGGTHTVKRGETLRRIAGSFKPEGVTVDQMLVAIFEANRSAFIDNNMNRLRSGAILSIPSQETAAAKSNQEARREVVAQASSFNAYRRRVAEATAATEARPEEAARQSAAGKIVPRVEEKAPPVAASGDQLKVSKSEAAAGKGGKGDAAAQARVDALQEDLIAREKSLKEANSRLAELEKNIGELQKLLEMKNQSLADLQKQSAAGAAKPAEPAVAKPAEPLPPAPAAEEAAAKTPEKAPEAAPTVKPEGEAAKVEAAPPPAEKPAAAPKPAPKKPVPEPVAEEPGFFSSLMDNPLALYGGGGALLALLAFAGLRSRQKKKDEAQPTTTLGQGGASSVFGSTGGQSVDTTASSIQTDFSHSGMAAIDADEGVDPVAEADVYMAYGRDTQAEEILLDALKTEPSRQAIRVKLLEIYAQRKSLKQFETLASELYSQTGGAGADWEKAAAMGRKLDPANPLYGSTGEGAKAAGAETLSAAAVGAVAAVGAAAVAETASVAEPEESFAAKLRDTWAMPNELAQTGLDAELDQDTSTVAKAPVADSGLEGEPVADLGFDLPELSPAPAVAEANVTEPAALDFDLGLDIASSPSEALEPVASADASAPAALEDLGATLPEPAAELVADLDLTEAFAGTDSVPGQGAIDFDLGPAIEPEVREQPSTESDVPVMDLERTDVAGTLIDFNLDELTATRPDSATEVMDLERTDVGGNLLDFNFERAETERPAAVAEMVPALDLSDIDLDLPELDATALAAEENPSVDLADAAAGLEGDDENAEAATKLDLAKAYEEMGDREGARELLEEVVREGTSGQQEKARNMLTALV